MIGITLRVPLGFGGIHMNKIGEIRGFLDTLNQKFLIALGARQTEPMLDVQYVSGRQGSLVVDLPISIALNEEEKAELRRAIDDARSKIYPLLHITVAEAIDCKLYAGGQLQQVC